MFDPEILLPFLLSAVAAYLIGSISFSIIFTRIFIGADVREYGSGNAGTTNVLRAAGKWPAILTFAGDFLKCVVAVLFAQFIFSVFGGAFGDYILVRYIAGFFCTIGHIYPVFFGFRGGKAVASTAALVLMVDWRMLVIAFIVFAIVFLIWHYVSLSGIVGVLSVPFSTYFIVHTQSKSIVWLDILMSIIIAANLIYAHRSNIKRLINGTESKIGAKKTIE